MPTIDAFDYTVFGLHIRSELRLPELLRVPPNGAPDVMICVGEVAASADSGPGLQATDHGAVLTIDGIARYAIVDGSGITVDRALGVPDANVRLYLLGSAMGVLLHQRGLLPLHANAVEIDGKAFAFMGASGAGKSTLAAWFHDHGYRIIADDICAVRFDKQGMPVVAPGLPRLRLWKEALEGTGREAAQFSRSYAGDETWDKFDVPLPCENSVRGDLPLAGLYLLQKGESLGFSRLTGVDATEAVFANTYRGNYVFVSGNIRGHWESCLRLAKYTPIFRLSRAWDLSRLSSEFEQTIAHASQLASL